MTAIAAELFLVLTKVDTGHVAFSTSTWTSSEVGPLVIAAMVDCAAARFMSDSHFNSGMGLQFKPPGSMRLGSNETVSGMLGWKSK
jgi:hypothetical protein